MMGNAFFRKPLSSWKMRARGTLLARCTCHRNMRATMIWVPINQIKKLMQRNYYFQRQIQIEIQN